MTPLLVLLALSWLPAAGACKASSSDTVDASAAGGDDAATTGGGGGTPAPQPDAGKGGDAGKAGVGGRDAGPVDPGLPSACPASDAGNRAGGTDVFVANSGMEELSLIHI